MAKLNLSSNPDIAALQILDLAYSIGHPLLSDNAYEVMRKATKKKHPKEHYWQTVGAPVINGEEVKLPSVMGSLRKLRPAEAVAWIQKQPKGCEFMMTPKMDGIPIEVVYQDGVYKSAATRGDGTLGRDVSHHAPYIQGVLKRLPKPKKQQYKTDGMIIVKGEVIIHKSLFDKQFAKSAGGKYSARRNFVGGLFNSTTLGKPEQFALSQMTFVVFGFERWVKGKQVFLDSKVQDLFSARQHGFTTILMPTRYRDDYKTNMPDIPWQYAPLENWLITDPKTISIDVINQMLLDWRQTIDIQQDGIVIELMQHRDRKLHDTQALRPTHAWAIKPDLEQQVHCTAVVASLEMNMTSRRIFKWVYILKQAADFEGAKVNRITSHNAAMLLASKAGPGATIKLIRSGDAIPRLMKTLKPAPVKLPTVCPYCKIKVQWTVNKQGRKVDLYCPNEDCTGPQMKQLGHFFDTLDVDGLRGGVLEQLVNAGYDTVPKIMTMRASKLAKIEGFGKTKSEALIKAINSAVDGIDLATLAHASGYFANEVNSLGSTRLQTIIDTLGQNTVLKKPIDKKAWTLKLLAVKGVGQVIVDTFLEGIVEFRRFQASLASVSLSEPGQAIVGPLSGMTFVWSSYRSPEEEARVIAAGGKVGGSVTFTTTCLFYADPTSGKPRDAERKGIKAVPKQEVKSYLDKLIK